MELRFGGRGLVQTKDDGKHAILPAGAARMQPQHPAGERGRLHGALDLKPTAEKRVVERVRVVFSIVERRRRWRRISSTLTLPPSFIHP
jgi:hypothetical protein